VVIEANEHERDMAKTLCELGGLRPGQAPGLAFVIATYREAIVHTLEVQLEQLAAEAEKAVPDSAAAYYTCIDRLRDLAAAVRKG
jgi:hypothetical protein